MFILLVGKFRHQIHMIDNVNISLTFEFSELFNFSVEVTNFIGTPNLSRLLAVLFQVDLYLLQIFKHLGVGFFDSVGWDEYWMDHAQVREWERNIEEH